jgi:DNA invertase Pin-like site-specific DNA recombinase
MRALIAARKSTKVDGSEGHSLHTQDQYSRVFCERLTWPVAGVAKDTVSGRTAPIDRKFLGRWLRERYTEFDAVVAFASDRLSRGDQEDWTRIEHWATEHSKVLVVVDSATGVRYPARDDSDYWQWTALKRQAGKEWDAIRERNIRSQTAIMESGHFLGRPPFAYLLTGPKYGKTLMVDEARRALAEGIFDRALAGVSVRGIAMWLRSQGVEGATQSLVVGAVNNWIYAGRVERNGQAYMQCPAIVAPSVLLAAQKALAGRARKAKGGAPSPEPALLVPKCAEHGTSMYRRGGGVAYYCLGHFAAPCDPVDAAVLRIVTSSDEPEMSVQIVEDETADKIEGLKRDQRQALEAGDIETVTALHAEIKALGKPVGPREEVRPTGRTVGEALAGLPRDELRKVLARWEVRLRADGGMKVMTPWARG